MVTSKKKPCKECPFRRDNTLPKDGKPGGSLVEVYVGQTEGPFWLPCHLDKNYDGKNSNHHKVSQCAGAAIYRSNIGVAEKMPEGVAILPEDKETVFASHQQFVAHYLNRKEEELHELFNETDIVKILLERELVKAEVKILKP
jgi:hypothetical protein